MKELTAEEYLQISRVEAGKAVQKVMDGFDFEKAAKALVGCDWKYSGASASPTVEELKTLARKIVTDVIQMGSKSSIHAGPLMAEATHRDTPAVASVELEKLEVGRVANECPCDWSCMTCGSCPKCEGCKHVDPKSWPGARTGAKLEGRDG